MHFHGHSYVHIICISNRLARRNCGKESSNFAVRIVFFSDALIISDFFYINLSLIANKNIRYIGLKAPIKTSITSTGHHNEFISTMATISLQMDNLLNPLAILFCYYSSVIFLRDILKMSPEKRKSNSVPLQTVNGNDFQVQLLSNKKICFNKTLQSPKLQTTTTTLPIKLKMPRHL